MREPRMKRSLNRGLRWGLIAAIAVALASGASADPVPARHLEGTLHGFLSLADSDGRVLATGDLIQVAHGDRVTMHLFFHFKDGSMDDETTVFTQRGVFRLISDHHIQKGPFFPHPVDLSIDVLHGEVTVRSANKDGKEQATSKHMKIPSDLYNGLIASIVKNVPPGAAETRVSMLVTTPDPRLVKMVISPGGDADFSLGGMERNAKSYEIKIELGGVAGIVAPLVGKAPANIHLWVVTGEVPVVVKEEGQTFEGGPLVSVSMASPVWPRSSSGASGN